MRVAAAISISTSIYARMLRCYPPNLRKEFGEDMIDLFAETVEAAWLHSSWGGVIRAWFAVGHDLTCIVLPYCTARAVPVLLAIITSIFVYGSLLATIDPNRH